MARGRTADSDEGFADRYLSAVDRDTAAGDRASAHDNRAAAGEDRLRAAASRARAAHDRDAAMGISSELEAEVAGLRRALETRNLIGQAQGVLIERYGMDAEEAFRALVRLSQEHNVKLREAARRLVEATVAEATVAERGASSQHLAAPPPTNRRPRVGRWRVTADPSGRSSTATNPLAGGGYR